MKLQGHNRGVAVAVMTIALIALSATTVSAQMADAAKLREIKSENPVSVPPAVNPFSLLDLSKLRFSSSYSVAYGTSSLGSSSLGMLRTTAYYDFSPKLSMAFSLGVSHNPGALFNKTQNADATLFPGFALDYHPSDKFRFNLNVQRTPYLYRYDNPYSYGGPGYYSGSVFERAWPYVSPGGVYDLSR